VNDVLSSSVAIVVIMPLLPNDCHWPHQDWSAASVPIFRSHLKQEHNSSHPLQASIDASDYVLVLLLYYSYIVEFYTCTKQTE